MLSQGETPGTRRHDLSRRAWLRTLSVAPLGLALNPWYAARALGQVPAPKARAVIVLWLWGGPSHLDTFDMKPGATAEYRGPFEPIATKVPGVHICELLPGLAARADRFALIRSMHHESNDHGIAGTIALTGNIAGAIGLDGTTQGNALRPSTGSIVGRCLPRAAGGLPPYVILGNPLHQGKKRVVGEGAGLLGSAHDPFRLDFEPGVGLTLPSVALPDEVSEARLDARWGLLEGVERTTASAQAPRALATMNRQYHLARTLIGSKRGLAALDLDRESATTRAEYGSHRFGQCCLIARRLVEAGLPFVQVNWSTHVEGPEDSGDGGWDMHDRYFQVMQDRHGAMFDRALSALLDDLGRRGLLDTTLVLALGEFGRTPKINDRAGRDHWNNCYSALVAGGGVQGGRVVGASDRKGEQPADRPVTPADLNATILDRLGIGAAELTGLGLTPMGQVIEELF